jgi:hypothetical protein
MMAPARKSGDLAGGGGFLEFMANFVGGDGMGPAWICWGGGGDLVGGSHDLMVGIWRVGMVGSFVVLTWWRWRLRGTGLTRQMEA